MRAYSITLVSLSLIATAATFAACSSSDSTTDTYGGGTAGSGGQTPSDDASSDTGDASPDSGSDVKTDASDAAQPDSSALDSSVTDTGNSAQDSAVDTAPEAEPDVNFAYDAPAYDAFTEACATGSVEATLKPLDLYFMVDRSGSMDGPPWTSQSTALESFFTAPQSAGLGIAMKFFPLNDNSPSGAACDGSTYTTPLVNWGTLTGNSTGQAATLVQAINATNANGGFTPTQDALNGVLKGALARQLAQPGHVVAAVIVSDGSPNNCQDNSASGMGAIAANYYSHSPSIRTFAIYVASDATAVMTQIASNGGTGAALDATGGTSSFMAAFKKIQGSAIPCDFAMPTSSQGIVNPDNVKLNYQSGSTTTPIPRVDDSSKCTGDGWYYDNPTTPTKIIMCPTTCTTMKADPNAKMNVELGCLGS